MNKGEIVIKFKLLNCLTMQSCEFVRIKNNCASLKILTIIL